MEHPSQMTPGELCDMREALRLTLTELGAILGTDARDAPPGADEPALARSARKRKALHRDSVARWEMDIQPISTANAEAFARLIAYTDGVVTALVERHEPGQTIIIYRDDGELHAAVPDLWPSLPAAWHRAVARRVKEQIPGARIKFAPRSAPEDPAA